MFVWRNKIMLAVIFAAFLFCNLAVPLTVNVIQEHLQQSQRSYQATAVFLLSGLVVELAFVAAVTGMGNQPSYEALPAGIVTTLIGTTTLLIGLGIGEGRSVSLEPSIFIMATGLIGFCVLYFGYRQFSLWRRVILGTESDAKSIGSRRQPLSIRFFMSLTGAVAFSIWLIRVSLPAESIGWPSRLGEMVSILTFVSFESLLINFLCMWIVLTQNIPWKAMPLVLVTVLTAPYLYKLFVTEYLQVNLGGDELSMQYYYLAGLTVFSLAIFTFLRKLGMRFRSYCEVELGPPIDSDLLRSPL